MRIVNIVNLNLFEVSSYDDDKMDNDELVHRFSLMYQSDYLLDKLEELDLNWQKKENSLTEQLKTYNSKIEELEKDLKA